MQTTAEREWLEHLWNHEIAFDKGYFELMSVNHSAGSVGIIGIKDEVQ